VEGKKTVGISLIVVGIVFVVMMLLADQIGIGSPEHGIGRMQKLGAVVGVVAAIGGAVLTFKK
jgi:hypothetical protein